MTFPKINLHIHSPFSDGKNSIVQIVKKSLKLGLKFIAITDHFTDSWKAQVIPVLDNLEKIESYLNEIEKTQDYLQEISGDLIVFKGIEIDIDSSEKFIKNLIKPDEYDLLLFEYLESTEGIEFIKVIIDYWKQNITEGNCFPILGLAHFDPSNFIHGDLGIIIQFLKENNIYFEFNSRYPEFYSRQNELFFEKLKEHKIPVAVGCDSHTIARLDDIEEPIEMIKYYSLEENYYPFLDSLRNRR